MKLILFILSVLAGFQIYSQNNLKPLIKAGYYQTFTNGLYLNELELGAGVQFNDYFSTQVNFRGSQDRLPQDPPRSFRIATFSIEPSYRILGKKHKFSPVIAYDAGLEIANNSKDRFIKHYIYRPYYQDSFDKYNKGFYFGKAKILLSIQRKGFDFLMGATYNTYAFKFYRLKPKGSQSLASETNNYYIADFYTDWQFGFGFETSIKYTFPMKKRAAKAQSGGE